MAKATRAIKTEPVFHFRHVVGPDPEGQVIMDSRMGFVDEELRRRVIQRGVDVGALVIVPAGGAVEVSRETTDRRAA